MNHCVVTARGRAPGRRHLHQSAVAMLGVGDAYSAVAIDPHGAALADDARQLNGWSPRGCGLVQGYFFSQPLDIDAAAALVSGDATALREPAPPSA